MPGINFRSIILSVLEADERIWFQNEEGEKELNQTLLLDLVEKIDDKIINLLLQEEVLREKFFAKISPIPPRPAKLSTPQEGNILYVFKINDFRFFMEENKIDNSYTAYKNRIGLTDGKKFLKDSNDIVLNWPYKDCILEGGQSNEEGTDTEVIVNDKLMNYELKKVKRKEIFFNSVLAPDEIDRLLDPKALVNWKRFTDNGELSMMNYELKRREDGTIAENMIIKGNNLLAMHSLKKQFAGKVKLIYIDPPYNTGNDGFKYNDNFNHSTWLTFMKNRLEVARELLREDGAIYVNLDFHQVHYAKILMDEIFGVNNFQREIIWRIGWLSGYKTADNNYIRNHDSILFYSKNNNILDFKKNYIENQNFKNIVKFDKIKEISIKFGLSKTQQTELYNFLNHNSRPKRYPIEDVWNSNEYDDLNSIAIVSFAGETVSKLLNDSTKEIKGQKSEKLIQRIILAHTQPGDIVLDYHLGSGTTAAVAHKMGRQYIGIEQMDYVETIAVERLKKVITGEQGGISKAVNWQGGGEFIYFELAKWNKAAKDRILAAESLEQLIEFFDEMYERYFLNYNLKIQEFRDKIIQEESFQNLALAEQKQIFIAMLDNNQMYVNKSEMSDAKFGISEEEQALTEEFYN
jgi:adenine-specific DNA-methyltransferase